MREQHIIGLEEGVRHYMTSLPAQRLKLWDRGILRPGLKADLVVFDLGHHRRQAAFGKPHQYSAGVRDVMVNGKFCAARGEGYR